MSLAAKKKSRGKAAVSAPPDPREALPPTAANCKRVTEEVLEVVRSLTPPEEPRGGDLVAALMHFILAEGLPCGYGQLALQRMEQGFVDRNELRVTEAFEVEDLLSDLQIPDLFARCTAVRDTIGQIYNDQNGVTLEFLRETTVTDRGHFFVRVPAITPPMQEFLVQLMLFEECLFSPRSTVRVQQRLGLDPTASHVVTMVGTLAEALAPFGHLPFAVGPDSDKVRTKPVLSPALSVVRLAQRKRGR